MASNRIDYTGGGQPGFAGPGAGAQRLNDLLFFGNEFKRRLLVLSDVIAQFNADWTSAATYFGFADAATAQAALGLVSSGFAEIEGTATGTFLAQLLGRLG